MPFVPDEPSAGGHFVPDDPGETKKKKDDDHDFEFFTKEALGAIGEPVLKMASGTLAKPISDIAGLTQIGMQGLRRAGVPGIEERDPSKVKEDVQRAFTYDPRTASGRSPMNPLNAIPGYIGKGLDWVGDKAQQGTEKGLNKIGVPPTWSGPISSGVKEAVEQAPGFLGAKGGAKLAEGLPAKQAALDAAKKIEAPQEAIRAAAKMDKEHPYITPPEHGVKAAAAGLTSKTRSEKIISKQNSESATYRFAKEVGMEEGTPLTPENIKERITQAYEGRQAMEAAVGPKLNVTPQFVNGMDDSLKKIVTQIRDNPSLNSDMVPAAGIIRGYLKKLEPPKEPVPGSSATSPKIFKTIGESAAEQPGPRLAGVLERASMDLYPHGYGGVHPARSMPLPAAPKLELSTDAVSHDISKLRDQAKTHFRAGDNALGYSKLGVANQLEQLFEDNLKATGKADLVDKFKADRVLQAKLHFIEDVVTPDGKVDLSKVASKANSKRYKGALTGELKTAADFARTWKKAAQPLTGEADPRFSVFDGMLAMGSATAAIATMNPWLMAPAAGELAGRYGVPGMAKRGMLQNAPPNYQVGATQRALPGVATGLGIEASQNRGPPPQ